MIEELYATYAAKARQEMNALYQFHEKFETQLRDYSHQLDFMADRGYSLAYIAVKEDGKIYAVFNVYFWEASGLYELDIETGFNEEINKMQKFIALEAEHEAKRKEAYKAKRKEQYETLKKEFE